MVASYAVNGMADVDGHRYTWLKLADFLLIGNCSHIASDMGMLNFFSPVTRELIYFTSVHFLL
jgi:hypothetical protein